MQGFVSEWITFEWICVCEQWRVWGAEPILPVYTEYASMRRAPETPGGPLALKDVLIIVSFLSLASGYENMNDHLF